MAAASLLPLLPIKIHRHASFNKSNLFCSFKSSHTLHSRLSTVSRICSSSHVGLDSGEEELDNSSIPSTESRWKSIGKRKVAMRVGYVGTNYRVKSGEWAAHEVDSLPTTIPFSGLQIQRDSGSIMTIEDELEKAILKVGGMLDSNYGDLHKIGWRRSSRTDKGVHSLATVIAVKMEIPDGAWEEDPDGIAFADVINRHLPNNIRIFSILPVNKRFDARMECISRKYVYLLPAEVIGIENDSSTEEVECHVKEFRAILQMFQIRKMVGTAVAVKRALMPQDLITISLSRFSRVVLPIAPSEVLILSSCEFSFPKELHSHGTKFEYSRLTASTKILGRVNDFYSTVLLPEVVDFLDPSKPLWKVWLENLDKSSGIPNAEMKELRDSWTQWKNVVFVENRVDTENDDSEILQTRQ